MPQPAPQRPVLPRPHGLQEPTPSCPSEDRLICSTCGPTTAVRVQSHDQCARCGRVLVSCCDGP